MDRLAGLGNPRVAKLFREKGTQGLEEVLQTYGCLLGLQSCLPAYSLPPYQSCLSGG